MMNFVCVLIDGGFVDLYYLEYWDLVWVEYLFMVVEYWQMVVLIGDLLCFMEILVGLIIGFLWVDFFILYEVLLLYYEQVFICQVL